MWNFWKIVLFTLLKRDWGVFTPLSVWFKLDFCLLAYLFCGRCVLLISLLLCLWCCCIKELLGSSDKHLWEWLPVIILHRTLGKSHVLSGKLSILRANVRDFPNKLVLDAKFTSFWWFFIICWLSILYISRYIFTPSISVVLSRHLSCFTLSSQCFDAVKPLLSPSHQAVFIISRLKTELEKPIFRFCLL